MLCFLSRSRYGDLWFALYLDTAKDHRPAWTAAQCSIWQMDLHRHIVFCWGEKERMLLSGGDWGKFSSHPAWLINLSSVLVFLQQCTLICCVYGGLSAAPSWAVASSFSQLQHWLQAHILKQISPALNFSLKSKPQRACHLLATWPTEENTLAWALCFWTSFCLFISV